MSSTQNLIFFSQKVKVLSGDISARFNQSGSGIAHIEVGTEVVVECPIGVAGAAGAASLLREGDKNTITASFLKGAKEQGGYYLKTLS